MTIFDTLHTARRGMMAHQIALNTTGQNVANVNTPGYSRKRAVFSSVPGISAMGAGGGVEISGIRRYTDDLSNQQLIRETSLFGSADQQAKLLAQASELFNDLGDTGLGSSLDDFFGALRQVQTNPEEATARLEVLARGSELAGAFNRISAELKTLSYNIDSVLEGAVEEVNIRTTELAELNKELALITAQGGDTSAQLDRRDRLVREISSHVNVSYTISENQQITLFLEGGLPLVENTSVSTLEVNPSGGAGSAIVEYVSPGGQAMDITSRLQGGAVGGALNVRDVVIPDALNKLDQLAYDLATSFNAQHALGFGLDGVIIPRNFFEPPAAVTDAAALLTLDAAVDGNPNAIAAALDPAGVPGDNRNMLELCALADQDLASSGTQTFNEAYAALSGEIGLATRQSNDNTTLRKSSVSSLQALKESQTGVSLDEEMVNLIQYQRSYEASARVLSVVSEVIQTLLNMR